MAVSYTHLDVYKRQVLCFVESEATAFGVKPPKVWSKSWLIDETGTKFSKCYVQQDMEIAPKLLFTRSSFKLPRQGPTTLMSLFHHTVVRRSQYRITIILEAENKWYKENNSRGQEHHNDGKEAED